MDIASALADAPARGNKKCKIGRWLRDIPADTPRKDELVAVVECFNQDAEPYRTIADTLGVLARLGLETSERTLGDHRHGRCRCSW